MISPRAARLRWVIYAVLLSALSFMFVAQVAPAALSKALTDQWHLEEGELGLMASAWFFSYAAFQIPAGIVADAWGFGRAATVGIATLAAASLLFALAPSFEAAVLARAGAGAGGAFIFMPTLRAIASLFEKERHATLIGTASSVGSIGALLGGGPLALAAAHFGWRAPIEVIALATAFVALLAFGLACEGPGSQHSNTATGVRKQVVTTISEGARELRRRPPYIAAAAVLALCYAPFLGLQALWAGPLMRDVYGFSAAKVGLGLLLISVGTIGSYGLAGLVSDQIVRSRKPLFIGGTCAFAALWGLTLAGMGELPAAVVQGAMLAFGLAAGLVLVVQMVVFDLAPTHIVGTVMGVINASMMLVVAIWQLMTGLIIQAFPLVDGFRWGLSPSLLATAIAVSIALRIPETFRGRVGGSAG